MLNNTSAQVRCFPHDVYYAQAKCNAPSWSGTLSNPESEYAQRNIAAVSCISTVLSTLEHHPAWASDPSLISKCEK